ncbi:MAG: T9SS type A sorting domain-containing protein, partial [Bacteroidota bacterium]
IVFSNNALINGSYGIYWVGLSTLYPDSCIIQNNVVQNSSYTGVYLYYNSNLVCSNNKITPAAAATYGIYCFYTNNSLDISGNNIAGQNANYGIQLRYISGSAAVRALIANNAITVGNGAGNSYGLWCRDANYARFYNNTVNVASTGTSSVPGYFYFSSAAYSNNEVKNNVLANSGGNYAMYNYLPGNTICNYNNLYTTSGSGFVQTSTGNYATFAAWRSTTGQDMRSVSYRPGFTSNTNLAPNLTDSAVWSLNGRALHIAQVTSSVNHITRPATYSDGAPDIGAFEFTPASLPPAAIATPAIPSAGTTQTFMFAGDTVARIRWEVSSNVPPPFSLRQASGEKAPFVFSEPYYTNFYLQSDMAAGSYLYTMDISYKEGWRGTQVNEYDSRIYVRNSSSLYMLNASSTVDSSGNAMSGMFYQDWKYFTGTDLYTPIPVKLVSFSAARDKKDVVLTWSTASEINNKGFEIERSFDGISFDASGFVGARKNTASVSVYTYTDRGAFKGDNAVLYYRLKQVDLNGTHAYSDVVRLVNKPTVPENISIYPNPCEDVFMVNIVSPVSSDAKVEVYDVSGKLVHQATVEVSAGDNRFLFDRFPQMNNGLYFVKVTSGEQASVIRLVKTK